MKKCKQILLAVCLTFAFVFLTACGSKEDEEYHKCVRNYLWYGNYRQRVHRRNGFRH